MSTSNKRAPHAAAVGLAWLGILHRTGRLKRHSRHKAAAEAVAAEPPPVEAAQATEPAAPVKPKAEVERDEAETDDLDTDEFDADEIEADELDDDEIVDLDEIDEPEEPPPPPPRRKKSEKPHRPAQPRKAEQSVKTANATKTAKHAKPAKPVQPVRAPRIDPVTYLFKGVFLTALVIVYLIAEVLIAMLAYMYLNLYQIKTFGWLIGLSRELLNMFAAQLEKLSPELANQAYATILGELGPKSVLLLFIGLGVGAVIRLAGWFLHKSFEHVKRDEPEGEPATE